MKIARLNPLMLIAGLLFMFPGSAWSQEEEPSGEEAFKRHKLSLYAGYSWIPSGLDPETGQEEFLIAPSIGFSYEYWITERWAIGTYNDMEIIRIQVEDNEGTFLERENAVVLSLGATWEACPRWTLSLGGGIETDRNETLSLVRLGTEYVLLEQNEWELSAGLNYIWKDVYDIFGIGFVLGKKF